MARKLKVYRTAIGFRDAYVAAPSQAAALRAWGTEKNLFARGAAELVEDPALAAEPLANPGEVVYRTRGSLAEQVAALGDLPKAKLSKRKAGQASSGTQRDAVSPRATKTRAARTEPSRPRPSRSDLEEAERALAEMEARERRAQADLRRRERALASERKRTEADFSEERESLRRKREAAQEAYDAAMREWQP